MTLEDLTPAEALDLCARAERACIRRFKDLAARSDPDDGPLRDLLGELETEERCHLALVLRSRTEPGALGEEEAARLLRRHFPSLLQTLGEMPLDRDAAMHYSELLEEESSRFYRALSENAADGNNRSLFTHLALGEWGHLERLRTVLLLAPPPWPQGAFVVDPEAH